MEFMALTMQDDTGVTVIRLEERGTQKEVAIFKCRSEFEAYVRQESLECLMSKPSRFRAETSFATVTRRELYKKS
jgi:hypothetical protein